MVPRRQQDSADSDPTGFAGSHQLPLPLFHGSLGARDSSFGLPADIFRWDLGSREVVTMTLGFSMPDH